MHRNRVSHRRMDTLFLKWLKKQALWVLSWSLNVCCNFSKVAEIYRDTKHLSVTLKSFEQLFDLSWRSLMRQKPAAATPVSARGSETISQTVQVKPYLWASGEVTQPLNEASIVFTCHLRRQHAHSLSSMASILILFNHLCISTTQTWMITMPQCNFVVTLYILSCRKFLNVCRKWIYAECLLENSPGSRCAGGGFAGKAVPAASARPQDDCKYKYRNLSHICSPRFRNIPEQSRSQTSSSDTLAPVLKAAESRGETRMLCVCAHTETDAFNNVNHFYQWSDMNRSKCFWGDRGSGS